MSIDGLLTFFGFLAAAYALLDEVSKRRFLLHVKRQLVLIAIAFCLVASLLLPEEPSQDLPTFYPSLLAEFVTWADTTALGTSGTAFCLVISWGLLAILLYKSAKPTAGSLSKLNILVERMLAERRYLELIDVVKPYVPMIKKASRRRLFSQRLYDWVKIGGPFRSTRFDLIDFGEPTRIEAPRFWEKLATRLRRLGHAVVTPLAHILPSRQAVTQAATDLEVSLLKSPNLTSFLVSSRADFIIDLMSFDRSSAEEFGKNVIRRMMNTSDSHFFREIKLMDTTYGRGGYVYEDQLTLMKKFLLDSDFACEHGIWKPVGDEAARMVREDANYREILLGPPPQDDLLPEDPVYATIQFFHALVVSAAQKSVEDHMWLMYMSVIARELIELHSDWSGENANDEFPTLGMRLIWEITNNHIDWINLFRTLEEANYHVLEKNINSWDNASILVWSVRDYSDTIRLIVSAKNLPQRFKVDRWSSYVRLISKIPQDGKFAILRSKLVQEAIEPSQHVYSSLGNLSAVLSELHAQIDSMLRYSVKDFDAPLGGPS